MTAREFVGASVAITTKVFFGPNADNVIGTQKKAKLVGQIEIGLVVRRGRKQDAAAVVSDNVIPDDRPSPAFPVSQIVALVNNNQAVTRKIRQNVLRLRY